MPFQRMIDTMQFQLAAVPINTTGAAVASDWFNMKNHSRMVFAIAQGAWAGGTPAVTLKQSRTNDDGDSSSKALSFSEAWLKSGLADPVGPWTHLDVTSDTFNLRNHANDLTIIEIHSGMLDRDNGYDYVQLNIASPGSNNDLIAVLGIFDGARNQGYPTVIVDD